MDETFKYDILYAMALAYGFILLFRFIPRIQAKLMGVPFVDPQTVKARMDEGEEILVIDVRMPHEFSGVLGHIDGALNLQSNQLTQKLKELGDDLEPYKNQRIVVTCRTQNRSPKAARILFQHGFTKISILNGGMAKWSKLYG
ncbi:MAG: hypothetical protein COB46_09635 [Rhodospirillaceae bacterium]|nr:MAG: hypothetical protein COB46_09635 [Rhodospirillaceae bacterium]